jgi:hypothetical protein
MSETARQNVIQLLQETEQLLVDEREALRTLDALGIESATERKTELEVRLRELNAFSPLRPEERALLERVRDAAQANQVLVVHARACVRAGLNAASGATNDGYPSSRVSAAAPLRVDVRG